MKKVIMKFAFSAILVGLNGLSWGVDEARTGQAEQLLTEEQASNPKVRGTSEYYSFYESLRSNSKHQAAFVLKLARQEVDNTWKLIQGRPTKKQIDEQDRRWEGIIFSTPDGYLLSCVRAITSAREVWGIWKDTHLDKIEYRRDSPSKSREMFFDRANECEWVLSLPGSDVGDYDDLHKRWIVDHPASFTDGPELEQ